MGYRLSQAFKENKTSRKYGLKWRAATLKAIRDKEAGDLLLSHDLPSSHPFSVACPLLVITSFALFNTHSPLLFKGDTRVKNKHTQPRSSKPNETKPDKEDNEGHLQPQQPPPKTNPAPLNHHQYGIHQTVTQLGPAVS